MTSFYSDVRARCWHTVVWSRLPRWNTEAVAPVRWRCVVWEKGRRKEHNSGLYLPWRAVGRHGEEWENKGQTTGEENTFSLENHVDISNFHFKCCEQHVTGDKEEVKGMWPSFCSAAGTEGCIIKYRFIIQAARMWNLFSITACLHPSSLPSKLYLLLTPSTHSHCPSREQHTPGIKTSPNRGSSLPPYIPHPPCMYVCMYVCVCIKDPLCKLCGCQQYLCSLQQEHLCSLEPQHTHTHACTLTLTLTHTCTTLQGLKGTSWIGNAAFWQLRLHMCLPAVENKTFPPGQRWSDSADNTKKNTHVFSYTLRHTQPNTQDGAKTSRGGCWVPSRLEGLEDYLIEIRVGGNHFFQGPLQRCHVINISPAALLQRMREKEGEGEVEGALLPKVAGSQQQQPTPVGRHRKGEWGLVHDCVYVDVCLYVGVLLKPLWAHPVFLKHSRLLFLSQRAFCSVGPRGVVTLHSFLIIPGVSLQADLSPYFEWILFTPHPLLCLHLCRYVFLVISWGKRWELVRKQGLVWGRRLKGSIKGE